MFPLSAPEHLATVAQLFGVSAPPIERARVLELGCSSGGNLIPFAARNPKAQVIGVDISQVQVDEGGERIKRLNLKNIGLVQGDLMNIGTSFGEFDYIICHGVYSWVPGPVQDAILRICRENLAENGIAYVSYNTYPGWKTREIIRDAMCLRANLAESERLPYARGMIDFLHEHVNRDSTLGKVIDDYQRSAGTFPDYYLLHEYLEPHNQPCYFSDFVERARAHELTYLAEAAPQTMFVRNMPEEVQAKLLAECGHSQVLMEQYLDFLANRAFRQTLLIKQERAGEINYRLDGQRMHKLHMSANLPCQGEPMRADDSEQTFVGSDGATVRTKSPVVKIALELMTQTWPCTLSFEQALSSAKSMLGELPESAETDLADLFQALVIRGMGRYRLAPVGGSLKKGLSDTARLYAATLKPAQNSHSFNAWHEPVILDAASLHLLPDLGGKKSGSVLAKELEKAVEKGELKFFVDGSEVTDTETIRIEALKHTQRALQQFCLLDVV
jgi:methyltransferase-like protein